MVPNNNNNNNKIYSTLQAIYKLKVLILKYPDSKKMLWERFDIFLKKLNKIINNKAKNNNNNNEVI